ncbi:MAG: hypothetical protein CVU46_09300 [Chloroflexi bacterium HGW-Chloroflexi-8]|nr:MAG: hypothetical protein CVU46_09300 [Chloroflexi bacterium HGW-Chloroflexi-8]
MAHTVVMPRYGATMEEGSVTYWAVKIGDYVNKGDLLGEIESEKLSNELFSEESGLILRIMVEAGIMTPCGTPILIIGTPEEMSSDNSKIGSPTEYLSNNVNKPIPFDASTDLKYSEQPVTSAITPKALQLAKENNVDYSKIIGTGRFNMITREDIQNFLKNNQIPDHIMKREQAISPIISQNMTQMQISIRKTLSKSLHETMQTTISFDLNVQNILNVHNQFKNKFHSDAKHPTITVIFIKIVAQALLEHPKLRTTIQDDRFVTKNEINIGVVIDIPDGLVVPNIKHADQKSIPEIAVEFHDLVQKARRNELTEDEVSGGTFTLSNLGVYGIKYFNPFLYPGECGMLGIGALQEVTQVVNNGIFIKPVININLTYDHGVLTGVPAAQFINTIQRIANEIE